jgi:hypothetical protein
VVGSRPDEVVGVLNMPNHSSRNMATGLTQLLAKLSTMNLPGR